MSALCRGRSPAFGAWEAGWGGEEGAKGQWGGLEGALSHGLALLPVVTLAQPPPLSDPVSPSALRLTYGLCVGTWVCTRDAPGAWSSAELWVGSGEKHAECEKRMKEPKVRDTDWSLGCV